MEYFIVLETFFPKMAETKLTLTKNPNLRLR
jgi:hypothetical protein